MSINGMGNTGRRVLRPVVLGIVAAFCVALALPASAYAACGPVALDPGHGGTEAGATGNGLKEEVLNWKIANYCKERLDQLGIPNFLTKQNYETLSRFERNQRAVAKNARALVSFHINSGGGQGAEVLITNTSSWNRFTNTESSSFGRTLLPRLSAAPFNLYNRGLKINNWQGVTYPDGSQADSMGINYYPRLTGTTGLIIEHAFIDNLGDAAKLKSESFLKQLGYADAEAIARQWPNSYTKPAASVVTKNGWRTEGGQRYYYKDGKKLTGWITVGGQRYWMRTTSVNGPVGSMGTGWLTDGGKRYFLRRADNQWGPRGSMGTGWLNDGGQRYFLDHASGAMRTGWLTDGGQRYWMRTTSVNGPVGSMGTGWLTDGGKRYFLRRADNQWGPRGSMGTGWLNDGGQRYFLDHASGAMRTGWLTDGGQRYWMRTTSVNGPVGSMGTGWITVGGQRYWMRTTSVNGPVGSMGTGWLTDGGKRYFLDRSTGVAATGTVTMGNIAYTFDSNGVLKSQVEAKNGWRTEGGQRYYYKDGKKLTGWITDGGKRYFLRTTSTWGPVGSMGTGWLTDGGKRYFLDHASGAMRTGWLTDGGKRYYLDPSTGAAATGVRKIDGKTCVFDGQGAQYVNCWLDGSYNPSNNTVPGSKVHYIDANGNEAYTRTTNTPIMGSSTMSKDKFVANFAKLIAPNYPSIYRSDAKYGATTPEAFATATWDAAVKEGVRPEVLAAQVGNETGWLKFGGIVNANQCNFGGIGALDGNANGNAATFPNVQTGLLAQAQHLKAYASKAALNQACVDPRFKYVTRGIAPNVEDLGAGNWASSKLYGRDLLSAMKSIQG